MPSSPAVTIPTTTPHPLFPSLLPLLLVILASHALLGLTVVASEVREVAPQVALPRLHQQQHFVPRFARRKVEITPH